MGAGGGEGSASGSSPGVRPGALSALIQEIAAAPEQVQEWAWERVLRPGAVVGRFELVRELGRGGFGVVWEARDRELGRPVAFKAIRPGGKAALREERLLREAEAAARLSHPNIVTLHDVGRAEQGPFLVLELLRGQTLSERLMQGPVPLAESVRVGLGVARGLAHAHGEGVVHRDLKPENVFLCADGQVKVLDFGLAHAFGRRRAEGGTAGYMAPEQAEGAPEDERTDVFALGVILFEMLSGKRPFAGEKALRAARAAPALEVPGEPALGQLVSRMLAKKAVERPRDGAEVLAALSALERELTRAPAAAEGRVRARRQRGQKKVRSASRASRRTVAPSIAVLPFANLGGDPEEEYFSVGLSEEILNALAHVQGLRVTGRTSSFSFKNRHDDLRTIGRKLGVRTVLEGSVRRLGSRVRIVAQLIAVADGLHLWAQAYDRELTDVFAVQSDIARAVAAALTPKLLPRRALTVRPAAIGAYNEFLVGRHLLNQSSQEAILGATVAFERAVGLEPKFAAAHAALSMAVVSAALNIGTEGDLAGQRRRALAEAEAAISIAPRLADGHAARAWVRITMSRDWAGAQSDLERALALKPGDSFATLRYGHLLAILGRLEEGIATTRRAIELDPLDPGAWAYLASYESARGAWAAARSAAQRALQIAPEHVRAMHELARIHLLEGDPQVSLRVAGRARAEWVRLLGTALAFHDLGRDGDSQRALDALVAGFSRDAAFEIAQVHAWRGDSDRAFEWLERAYTQSDPGLRYLRLEPVFRRVRDDERFTGLLRKVGLPLR